MDRFLNLTLAASVIGCLLLILDPAFHPLQVATGSLAMLAVTIYLWRNML